MSQKGIAYGCQLCCLMAVPFGKPVYISSVLTACVPLYANLLLQGGRAQLHRRKNTLQESLQYSYCAAILALKIPSTSLLIWGLLSL